MRETHNKKHPLLAVPLVAMLSVGCTGTLSEGLGEPSGPPAPGVALAGTGGTGTPGLGVGGTQPSQPVPGEAAQLPVPERVGLHREDRARSPRLQRSHASRSVPEFGARP